MNTMKVQTSGLGSGLTVKFELSDLTLADQRELFVMAGRQLGIFGELSATARKELDDLLLKHSQETP